MTHSFIFKKIKVVVFLHVNLLTSRILDYRYPIVTLCPRRVKYMMVPLMVRPFIFKKIKVVALFLHANLLTSRILEYCYAIATLRTRRVKYMVIHEIILEFHSCP